MAGALAECVGECSNSVELFVNRVDVFLVVARRTQDHLGVNDDRAALRIDLFRQLKHVRAELVVNRVQHLEVVVGEIVSRHLPAVPHIAVFIADHECRPR